MKKFITPFATTLLALGFTSLQADAQRFYTVLTDGEPTTQIDVSKTYLLHCPWYQDGYHYLSGTSYLTNPEEHAAYQFEAAGQDADENITYRLKQVATGLYLENPELSNGKVTMTESPARAFVFTALEGQPFSATYNENGQNLKSEGWDEFIRMINEDPRQVYDDQSLGGIPGSVVFANKDYATSGRKVLCFSSDPTWDQYAAQRIFHLYEAEKSGGFDNIVNSFMYGYYPEDEAGAAALFSAGTAPGQVAQEKVDAFVKAWKTVKGLYDDGGQSYPDLNDPIYQQSLDALAAAKKACAEGVNPVTEGYYVIDNNPSAGRPAYAGTSNACMFEKDGALYWTGFNKPDTMTVEDASFIWEVQKAEDGGWYLRNYGTDRYAGSLSANYQVVPSTAEPKQVYDINFQGGQFFSLDQRGQNATYPALHADQNPGLRIVIWTSEAGASQWRFLPVSVDELKGIEGELEQNRINNEAKGLIEQAEADYSKGFTYKSEGMTHDGVFGEVNGLVTDAAGLDETGGQLISNAMESPANEPGNCYKNLIDNDFGTYFHTVWSSAEYSHSFHYLDVKLNEAVEVFNIKYAKRHNNQNGSPTKIHVFASNDTTNGNWTDQGFMTCDYPYSIEHNGETKKNFAGVANKVMDAPYTYVRLSVEGTEGMSKTNDNLYWYWSEFRMYKAEYDPAQSLINAVPENVKNDFTTLLAQLKEQLAAKAVSKTTLDAFKKAYETFLDNYPDPQIVKDLLAEARAFAAPGESQEGDGLGYFASGASADLTAALDAVEGDIKDLMTVAEIKAVKEKIETALNIFNSKFNVPADGAYFYIKCATSSDQEGSAMDAYVRAANNDESQVKYAKPEDASVYLHYIWKTIKHDDGTYSFQNCGTGTYLGNPKKNDAKVMMSFDADTLGLRSAKEAGVFNIVCGENFFYNAQPSSGNIVTWGQASGLDNSAFILEPAEGVWDETTIQLDLAKSGLQVISVPFEFKGASSAIYKVLGVKEGKLQLAAYGDEEVVPGGVPFIANIEAEEGYAPAIQLYANGGLEELTYNQKGEVQNGLKAAIQSVDGIAGAGIFFGDKVINATDDDIVAANTGYFASMPSVTEETGVLEIEFPATIVETGISNLVLVPAKSAKAGVYTLTGVKLSNGNKTQNLPKGLYIVGGEKVLVK